MTYTSNVSGRTEVYAIPFDPAATAGAALAVGPWQFSDQGGNGMVFWRKDGKELYYLGADRAVMVVEVTGGATPKFGKPQVLFKPSADIAPGIGPENASVSRDGERFVIAVPRPQLRQLTVYDRAGKVVSRVGEPGFYNQPNISPDATRAVVMRVDPRTGNNDIWTMDFASGKGTPLTNDTDPQNAADLVAGWEAGRLRVDAREHLNHLPPGGRRQPVKPSRCSAIHPAQAWS